MKIIKTIRYKKIATAMLLVFATQIALASFTGTSDRRSSSSFSLKNFHKNFHKTASPFSLKAGYNFKGFQVTDLNKDVNGTLSMSSYMRYEKGNTSYIYPYKHKISLSKFITPAAPAFR